MKIKFKHQRFQQEAAKAVCDVFVGQPLKEVSYMIDPGMQHTNEIKYSDIYGI
jgi:type III restriction enzyme